MPKLLADLVEVTGLRAIGEPLLSEDGLKGMQLIAESHVAVHVGQATDLEELGGLRVGELYGFVDVFSCKPFDPGQVLAVLRLHLGGVWQGRPVGDSAAVRWLRAMGAGPR